MALVFGRDDANNPVPYVVYVWLWVGMPFLSLVFGAVWAVLNPVRWLHRGIAALARIPRDFTLTDLDLGYWPAAAGLLAFTWLELVAPDRTTLLVLRLAVGLFVLVSVVGLTDLRRAVVPRGRPVRGALATLRPDVAPRPATGRAPGAPHPGPRPEPAPGAPRPARHGGRDARRHGVRQPVGGHPVRGLGPVHGRSRPGPRRRRCSASWSSWRARCTWRRRSRPGCRGVPVRGVAADLAPSLLPIAAGYLVAHYYSLLAFQGPRTLALLSDPLGTGADWLGHRRGRAVGLAHPARLWSPSSRRWRSSSDTCSASWSPTSGRSGSCRTARPSSARCR